MGANQHMQRYRSIFQRPHDLYLLAGITLGLIIVVALSLHSYGVPLISNDPKYYVAAGKKYVEGLPPLRYNFEHPPLAKYIIGVCAVIGFASLCSLIVYSLTLVFFAASLKTLGLFQNRFHLAVFMSVFATDPLLLSLGFHNLLDTYMLFFFAFSLYMFSITIRRGVQLKTLIALGAGIGASLASKLVVIYPLLGVIIYLVANKCYVFLSGKGGHAYGKLMGIFRAKYMVLIVSVAVVVYIVSFSADVVYGGLAALLEHQVKMISFMLERHGYSIPIAVNGILKYFLRIELWNTPYSIQLYIHYSSSLIVNWSTTYTPINKMTIIFVPYLTNLLMPFALGLSLSYLLSRKEKNNEIAIFLSSLHIASLLMLLHGPLWWYYALPVVTGYLILAYWANNSRKRLLGLLVSQLITWLIFVAFNVLYIPTRIMVAKPA